MQHWQNSANPTCKDMNQKSIALMSWTYLHELTMHDGNLSERKAHWNKQNEERWGAGVGSLQFKPNYNKTN